jgi:hypothetical protein
MSQDLDSQVFQQAVAQELAGLRRRLPEWFVIGTYADPLWPEEALERREAERLARLGRVDASGWRERTRERVAREQAQPWREQDRWGLRKRVWRERRDHERELLERRERELLERDEELSEHFGLHIQWLDELRALEPESRAWCDELAELVERRAATLADLNQLWQRRKRAAQRWAKELLAREELRTALSLAINGAPRDIAALARAITPALAGRVATGELPGLPVLFAAITIEIERMNRIGPWAKEQ